MIVEIPIPDDKVAAFTIGFLEICPIPQILDPEWEEGVDPDRQPMVDEYTKAEKENRIYAANTLDINAK